MKKVFVDGGAGTTGLEIVDRLKKRNDIEVFVLPEEKRKDDGARKAALNGCDLAILCLPDAAAVAAAEMIEDPRVKVIDASTAHRTASGWTYGFAEIGLRENIKNSFRVANPGCHASGFISLVAPLVKCGILSASAKLTCFSVTGYTGGGKKMIGEYEGDKPFLFEAPRQYAISQAHKHLPEMKAVCGLDKEPIFCPIVADFPRGMQVTVPLFASEINGTIEDIKTCYKEFYTGKIVRYSEREENGFLSACEMAGSDALTVSVCGNEERILLVASFDNLGKGASGAAIQNMNIMLGFDETKGLNL